SALALSGSAKDAALTALLTAPALIEEQGGTPPSLEDYATAARMDRASDGTHPIAAVTGPDLDADAPGHLAAGAAKTPGKRQGFAMIFTALGGHDAEPYFDAIQAEGYEALVYYNPKTIGAFAATSRSGALYNVTHSSPNSLS